MITFSSLQEILKPEQKKEVDTWEKGDNSFSNHLFDHPEHTEKTIPLEHPGNEGYRHEVESHLEPHGIKIKDYKSGIGEDKHGREIKLGKALVKTKAPDELKNKFDNDEVRSSKESHGDDLRVTISRHPHHVAGMTSEGHCWDSCLDYDTGSNKHYLPDEVKHGTHVAYLHHKDDKELEHPLARIALKKFTDPISGHAILRQESKTYGPASDSFAHTVHKFLHNKMPARDSGIYEKNEHVYDDDRIKQVLGSGILHHKIDDKNFEHDVDARHDVYQSRLTPEHIDKAMNKGLHSFGLHPDATKKQTDRAVDEIASTGNLAGMGHNRKLNSTHIHKLIDSPNLSPFDKESLLHQNQKTNSDHVMKYINQHPNVSNVAHMFRSDKLSAPHIHKLIDRIHDEHYGDPEMLRHMATNPNLNHDHLDKILSGHPYDKNIHRQLMYRDLLPHHVDHIKRLLHPKDFHDVAIHASDTTGNLKENHIHSIIDELSKDSRGTRTEAHISNLIKHKHFNADHAKKLEDNQFSRQLVKEANAKVSA